MRRVRVFDTSLFFVKVLFRQIEKSLERFDFLEISGGLQAQLVFRLVHEQGTKLLYAVLMKL